MNYLPVLSILAAAGLATAGSIYTLADLGSLYSSSATAMGVNELGQVAGTMTTALGSVHAFSASAATGLIDLTAGSQGQAAAINNAGQIAGTQYLGGESYGSVWSSGVATTAGPSGSYAMAIDNAGDVAGSLIQNGQGNAFVTQNGTVIDLGTFAGGSWSAAYGMNDAGQVAGSGLTASGNFRAFIWTPGEGYTVLGSLGGANSYAMAINEFGEVAGNAQLLTGYSDAFVSKGASMQDLGTLGGSSSFAYGINDLGNAVGYSWTTGNASMDGFIEQGGVMVDINSLLVDAPGWQITQLFAINDSNQVVGVGILNGVEHAVLLTDPPAVTPEPATWIYMLAGLALVAKFTRSASPLRPLQLDPPPVRPR
jgi:probable HAF family extracellular repeat protein